MSVSGPKAVRDLLQRAFADGVLSAAESARVLADFTAHGATAQEAAAVVDTVTEALQPGTGAGHLDILSTERRSVVNKLLAALDAKRPLPLDKTGAPKLANGAVDFVALLTRSQKDAPPDAALASFAGRELAVARNGELSLDAVVVTLDATAPAAPALEALWALDIPGQIARLGEPTRVALSARLATLARDATADAPTTVNRLERQAALTAAAGALAQMGASWSSETIEAALTAAASASVPLARALLLAGLDRADLSRAQKTRRAALSPVEDGPALLAAFDALRSGAEDLGGLPAKGRLAQLGLTALACSRNPSGRDNFGQAVAAWSALNGAAATLDDDELAKLSQSLATYVNGADTGVFVFAAFAEQSGKDVGQARSERLMAALEVGLSAAPPHLYGYPLTPAQVTMLRPVLDKARDANAVDALKTAMNLVAAAFRGDVTEKNASAAPREPIAAAAFDYLARALRVYVRGADSSPDGKLGFDDLLPALRQDAGALGQALAGKLGPLGEEPPRWGALEVSAEAAAALRAVLVTNVRSAMSVGNLDRAVRLVALANGGEVKGEAASKLVAVLNDYRALYPDLTLFDFNKLERLAKCKLANRPYPTFSINGESVSMAKLYQAVGTAVATGVDRARLDYPWMADRWGQRAKAAVEVLDVVAEQAARGEGPLALLRSRYPGKSIEVQVTGRDGDHEQFIYAVKDGASVVDYFTQGSDGTLGRYTRVTTPVLFTADIDEAGGLAVTIAQPLVLARWPMQQTYGVGDSIDVPYNDPAAKEKEVEGRPFSTRYKILEAKITSFTAAGVYTVAYTLPSGAPRTVELDLAAIRAANNPHYFALAGSVFSDVSIDVANDAPLRAFVDGARPIIAKYLPTDGSLVGLAPAELAERQRECLAALQAYTAARIKYPDELKKKPDAASRKYHALTDKADEDNPVPLGTLLELERGECRHMAILAHLLCEVAGIDSRLASGAANDPNLTFRGYHIWQEVTLADNQRYLSDQTWNDVAVPLWTGAYGVDARRLEMSDRTAALDDSVLLPD